MIIKNANIFTNSEKGFIENGWIVIEEERIKEVGEGIPAEEGEVIDAKGKLLMPGFVNAHTHIYSTLARGIPLDIHPRSFSDILSELWWKLDRYLDRDAIYYSALIGGIESLKSGVTTLIDHHASYGYIKGSLNTLKEVLLDTLGLRVDLCYEISDRWGKGDSERSLEESFDFLEYVRSQKNPLLSTHIGLHASFTLQDETLKRVRENTPWDIGFHIHLAEGIEDQIDAIKAHGKRVVERLLDYDILRDTSIVVHGIRLTQREIEILKEKGPFFAHAPQSNMNNGVGIQDIGYLMDKGINVVLGNDGFGFNILNDLRVMMLSQKHEHRDFNALGFENIYKIFFENNYKLLEKFFPGRFGKIEEGYMADFVIFDYIPPTPLTSSNMLGHLIFGLSDRVSVDKVFVGGRLRVDKGRVLGVDESKVYKEAQYVSSLLWKRIGG